MPALPVSTAATDPAGVRRNELRPRAPGRVPDGRYGNTQGVGRDVEYTEDGRWIVVDGRRWRREDPALPEDVRTTLVSELMGARRAVGAAKRADDAEAERAARDRVQAAKVALGERGTAWWERPEGVRIADARAFSDRLRHDARRADGH